MSFENLSLAVITITLVVIVLLIWKLDSKNAAKRKDRLNRVLCSAPRLYRNENGGIVVLVKAFDYGCAMAEYEREVKSGAKKPWERITLFVQPAFTFHTTEEAPNFMQCGGRAELTMLIRKCVDLAADFPITEGMDFDFRNDRLVDKVIPESPYIFVPFSSNAIPPEKQAEMFPKYSFMQACGYLLHDKALPPGP